MGSLWGGIETGLEVLSGWCGGFAKARRCGRAAAQAKALRLALRPILIILVALATLAGNRGEDGLKRGTERRSEQQLNLNWIDSAPSTHLRLHGPCGDSGLESRPRHGDHVGDDSSSSVLDLIGFVWVLRVPRVLGQWRPLRTTWTAEADETDKQTSKSSVQALYNRIISII